MSGRRLALTILVCLTTIASAQELRNEATRVAPLGKAAAWTGVRVAAAEGGVAADLWFGSLGNIVAAKVEQGQDASSPWLRFSGLTAVPTPKLGAGSYVTVRLYPEDPYPQVSFRLELAAFDVKAWQAAFGTVPFHFLACAMPGAEIFHQRGWSIMTPALDPYTLQNQATGYGRQVTSTWSEDWSYAPAIGAYPLATVGLWHAAAKRWAALDFHGARLTDHSEKDIGSSYCWQLEGKGPLRGRQLDQFFTLVWPYAKPYRTGLRYPTLPEQGVVASHARVLYSLDLPGKDDPTLLVHRFVWDHYRDLLPTAPTGVDLSWIPSSFRPSTLNAPGVPSLYGRISADDARWFEAGALVFGGAGHDGDGISYAYETGKTADLARLKQQIQFLLPYARRETIDGDDCVMWQQPLEGEGNLELFGKGVPTVHHKANWELGTALLEVYLNQPEEEAELLPYVDGLVRWTKHILATRNGIPDVPTAQFCYSAATVNTFCLRYWLAFRNAADPEHRGLAETAHHLAHSMLYRNLPIWISDNDDMDGLDSTYFCEPNLGISWLGSACANEVWWVAYALAQEYVHSGDPLLSQYLLGMMERWHELYRNDYYPSVADYDGSFAERLGLYDGADQARGTRAAFGGLWGQLENLIWPVGTATVRVLCGEQAALAFCRNGLHTAVAEYRYHDGAFSFRLAPAARGAGQDEPFDVMVTMPLFDLRKLAVLRVREGFVETLADDAVERYPQRPDTVLVRGMRYGDAVAVGRYEVDQPILPCPIAKPQRGPVADDVRLPAGFKPVDLVAQLNQAASLDWTDLSSMAGWEPGRKALYGVPFDLLDPAQTGGRLAVRDAEVPAAGTGSTLFALVGGADANARLTAVLGDGSRVDADLSSSFAVLRGWPPCFEWHVDWVALPLGDKALQSLRVQGLNLYAATLAELPATRLAATFAATAAEQHQARVAAAAVRKLRDMAPLFEAASGHIAVLPGTANSNPRSGRVAQLLHQAGLIKHLTFLTPQQYVDPATYNATNYWVTLYLQGEGYLRNVARDGDGEEAIRRYLAGGGTLLLLPNMPYPFYYDEHEKAIGSAEPFGLFIANPWEAPPAGHTWTFKRGKQDILTSMPETLPFPTDGDKRFRPMQDRYAEGAADYTPLITLVDEKGTSQGEAAAWVELKTGDLAGGRIGYVWSTLLLDPRYQVGLLTDLLRHALTTALPGLAAGPCYRAAGPITVDGKLDEPIWGQAPAMTLDHLVLTDPRQPPKQPTAVRCAWDEQNLYVGFAAQDSDVWSKYTARDDKLWEEEVLEVYLDPDGDGLQYKEFEINPLGTVIDLNIEDPAELPKGKALDWRAWNADGWQTAVAVDGTVAQRDDRDRGWTVEMAIPFADLGVPAPKVGDTWRVQFYRIDRPGPEDNEYSSWSATDTFHRPSRFGRLSFAANAYDDDFSLYPDGSSGAPNWLVDAGTWQIHDGVLSGTDSGTGAWRPVGLRSALDTLTDFRLSLRYRLVEKGSDGRDGFWIGVRCHGAESGYSVNLRNAALLHKFVGSATTNDSVFLASAPFGLDNAWHDLVIVAQGDRITVTQDGRDVVAGQDQDLLGLPAIEAGGIVLSARKWENSTGHTRVEVDQVRIEPLNAGG